MSEESPALEWLSQTLPNLSDDDLFALLKTLDERRPLDALDSTNQGKRSTAQGTFYRQSAEPPLSHEAMFQLIDTLNPAELFIFRELALSHLNRASHTDGDSVVATIGSPTADPLKIRYSIGAMWSLQKTPPDDFAQRAELFKNHVAGLQHAFEAKSAGDLETANALLERVLNMLKEQGASGAEIEYMRNQFQRR